MAGVTIDHMVAVITFLAAFLIFLSITSQIIQTAVLYQKHRQLAIKCSDLLDNILLTPGIPVDWGEMNVTPTSFGLQHPDLGGYMLSPFSTLRLQLQEDELIFYNRTGEWYSNYSLGSGVNLYVPASSSLDYNTVVQLLGINGTYDFRLVITPLITVEAQELNADPLEIEVFVRGPGGPISNANITCYLYKVYKPEDSDYPSFTLLTQNTLTGDDGKAILEFSDVDAENIAYAAIIYATVGDLNGVGCIMKKTTTNESIVPFIVDFEAGKVLLAHSWDVHYYGSPVPAIFYNASFFLISENFALTQIEIENSTGKVTYGSGKPYNTTVIPTFDPGFLLITYRGRGNRVGAVVMPWGICSLGVSVTFGKQPTNAEWVATDMRIVIIHGVPYRVDFALWSLEGYQVRGETA